MPGIDERLEFRPLRIAILTVSDTRDESTDKSGGLLVRMLTEAGHELAARAIVTDTIAQIQGKVKQWIENSIIDAVISTGGSGLMPRDVTPEAMKPLFEKEIDGFSALMHRISFDKIGTSTIQSRCCAGLANHTLIFVLPGSPGAVKDAWNGILKNQFDSRYRPCNFTEILPRMMRT